MLGEEKEAVIIWGAHKFPSQLYPRARRAQVEDSSLPSSSCWLSERARGVIPSGLHTETGAEQQESRLKMNLRDANAFPSSVSWGSRWKISMTITWLSSMQLRVKSAEDWREGAKNKLKHEGVRLHGFRGLPAIIRTGNDRGVSIELKGWSPRILKRHPVELD